MTEVEDEVILSIRGALEGATDWLHVGEALRRNDGDTRLEVHRAAFMYMLVERSQADHRTRYGPIAPMMESAGRVYPAPLDHLPAGATESWALAIVSIDAPLLQARYGDLLWLTKTGATPYRYALLALAGYEALSHGDDELLTATHSAQRAIELARELNDAAAVRRLASRAVLRATGLLRAGPEWPGVVMRLLEAAADVPVEERPRDLLEAVLLAEKVYGERASLGDAVADLLARLTPDPASMDAVRRRQMGRWEAAVSRSTGIERLVHLQHALELGALHQLPDLRERLRHQLQDPRTEPIELREVGVEMPVPGEQIDRMVAALVGDDSAVAALQRLGSQSPIGDLTSVRDQVGDQMKRNPIRFLATGMKVGDENTVIRYLRTPEEHFDAQLRDAEVLRIRVFGALILLPSLDAIVARYGTPSPEDVGATLGGGVIDPALAARLAVAIDEYFDGAYDCAAHLLAPRLERGIRELGRQAGAIVVREPVADHAGGVRPLGAILDDLRDVLPEDWRRYFVNLLTDELGVNLRNRISHGLVDQVTREDAALLVHAAFVLSLIRLVPADAAP